MRIAIYGFMLIFIFFLSIITVIAYILHENSKKTNNITAKKDFIPTKMLIIANILSISLCLHETSISYSWFSQINSILIYNLVTFTTYIIYFLLLSALIYRILRHKRDKMEKIKNTTIKAIKKDKYVILYYWIVIIILLVLLSCVFFTIDCKRVQNDKLPIFCIRGDSYLDGGTTFYYGMGYKVIDFHVLVNVGENGRPPIVRYEAKKIGSWTMKYSDFDDELKEFCENYSYIEDE